MLHVTRSRFVLSSSSTRTFIRADSLTLFLNESRSVALIPKAERRTDRELSNGDFFLSKLNGTFDFTCLRVAELVERELTSETVKVRTLIDFLVVFDTRFRKSEGDEDKDGEREEDRN